MGAETPFVTREDIEDPITISQFRQYRDICIPQEWRAPVAGVKIGGAMYGGISNRMVAFYPLHGRFDFLGEILYEITQEGFNGNTWRLPSEIRAGIDFIDETLSGYAPSDSALRLRRRVRTQLKKLGSQLDEIAHGDRESTKPLIERTWRALAKCSFIDRKGYKIIARCQPCVRVPGIPLGETVHRAHSLTDLCADMGQQRIVISYQKNDPDDMKIFSSVGGEKPEVLYEAQR